MSAYGHNFDVNKTVIVFPIINYKLTYVANYLGHAKIPFLLDVCLCCHVLFCRLIMCLCHAVHGFLTNLHCWSFHFCPTGGCWNVHV